MQEFIQGSLLTFCSYVGMLFMENSQTLPSMLCFHHGRYSALCPAHPEITCASALVYGFSFFFFSKLVTAPRPAHEEMGGSFMDQNTFHEW